MLTYSTIAPELVNLKFLSSNTDNLPNSVSYYYNSSSTSIFSLYVALTALNKFLIYSFLLFIFNHIFNSLNIGFFKLYLMSCFVLGRYLK